MRPQTANLFLLEELDEVNGTSALAPGDRSALRDVAEWIESFVIRPNENLGRAGPVCPFVPVSLERKTLWLAPDKMGGKSVPAVIQLLNGYKQLLQTAQPTEGDDVIYKAIIVVVSDVSAQQMKQYADDAEMQQLKRRWYVDDGVVLGEFHERNEGTAIYNGSFQPFRSPQPFFLLRNADLSDWKFFLDNDEWLGLWARRHGESAVPTLAEVLRRTDWRRLES